MAATGIKFDDGSGGFATNCFPVRGLVRQTEDGSGAWLVAARAEQRRRFKAVICAKPRDFETIRQERKRAEKEGTAIVPPAPYEEDEEEDDTKILDGFFLMKHCCVDDPADLCSVNISGQGFNDVKEEDFALFDNVAYVNAAENFLPMESFTHFPIIRELEVPLNGIMGTGVKLGDFLSLESLDLSYNNLTPHDILPLGLLPKLRVLHLTGNGLHNLPPELSRPHVEQLKQGNRKINRFPALEILLLDDNKLSDLTSFAALAGLRNLKHLNMSKNEIRSVPQLMLVEGRHVTQEFDSAEVRRLKSGHRSGRRSRAKSSRASHASSAASRKSRSKTATHPETDMKGATQVDTDVKNDLPAPQNTSRTSPTHGAESHAGLMLQNGDQSSVKRNERPDKGNDNECKGQEVSNENTADPNVNTEVSPPTVDVKPNAENTSATVDTVSGITQSNVEGKATPSLNENESAVQKESSSETRTEVGPQNETNDVAQSDNAQQSEIPPQSETAVTPGNEGAEPKETDGAEQGSNTLQNENLAEQSESAAQNETDFGAKSTEEGENALQDQADVTQPSESVPQNETDVRPESIDATPPDNDDAQQKESAPENQSKTPVQSEVVDAPNIETEVVSQMETETAVEKETVIPQQSESEVNITADPASSGSDEDLLEDKLKSSDSLFDLDGALEELNLDKIDEKIEQKISEEKAADEEDKRRAELVDRISRMSGVMDYDGDDPLPPPFPELRYLDLSHNLIAEEEGLLAVAAWPMLSELLIHKNPLTMETSGDPPLLQRFLHDRLGIHLQRKDPGPLQKPHIEVHQKPERTVKTKIYPVPRIDVDALLAIEAPKSREPLNTAISEKTEPRSSSAKTSSTPVQGAGFDPTKPLPPIPPTPDEDDECEEYDEDFEFASPASSARSEQQADAFFMTAVGDQPEEESSPTTSSRKAKTKRRKIKREDEVDERYKGYEALLDIDESQIEDAIPLPKDISGNIRALQYSLNHPLVFRDNKVHLDKIQKPFKPYVKSTLESSKSRKPRSQTVEEALATVRERKTVEEEPLIKVLKDKKKYRKHFSNASGLLNEVQRKYNMVRASSMRENKQLQDIMQETIQNVQNASDNSQLTVS